MELVTHSLAFLAGIVACFGGLTAIGRRARKTGANSTVRVRESVVAAVKRG